MAVDKLKKARASEVARAWAESVDKAERDYITGLHMARQEGRHEGRQEGRQEGRAQGQQDARLETAHRMLDRGFDDAAIADLTGLSPRDIAALRGR